MRMIIIKNAIKCNHCGDVIESEYTHDYKNCSCGCVAVDGGHDYLRRSFKHGRDDYTELSVCVKPTDSDEQSKSDKQK